MFYAAVLLEQRNGHMVIAHGVELNAYAARLMLNTTPCSKKSKLFDV